VTGKWKRGKLIDKDISSKKVARGEARAIGVKKIRARVVEDLERNGGWKEIKI